MESVKSFFALVCGAMVLFLFITLASKLSWRSRG